MCEVTSSELLWAVRHNVLQEGGQEAPERPLALFSSEMNQGPSFLSFQMLILVLLRPTVPDPQISTSSKSLAKGTMGR